MGTQTIGSIDAPYVNYTTGEQTIGSQYNIYDSGSDIDEYVKIEKGGVSSYCDL